MESVILKIQSVLDNLNCGYKFFMSEKVQSDGTAVFHCPSSMPFVFGGLRFNVGLSVELEIVEGDVVVEYQCARYYEMASLPKDAVLDCLKQKGVSSNERACVLYNNILSILDSVYEQMFQDFAREFEAALPDIHIVDRLF